MSDFRSLGDIFSDMFGGSARYGNSPVMTGFGELDELLEGMQESSVLILGGRPSSGKSALATNIAVNAAKQGSTVGIFSLEMSMEQLNLRILACEAEVDVQRLRLGLYTEAEEQRIIDSISDLSNLPLYVDDTPIQGIAEMRTKAEVWISEPNRVDLLVVDYLQLVQGRNKGSSGESRVQQIDEIIRSIKILARELRVPVIACSQLSRKVDTRPDHRPLLRDLRDGGSIEQTADIVMFIYREELYYTEDAWDLHFPERTYPRNIAEIIVAKNRHGPIGSRKLRSRDNLVRFETLGRDEGF